MELPEALRWLDQHVNLEAGTTRRIEAPTLDRIRALMALLGSPELSYPAVHVTGTNGKTSVTRLASALLAHDGLSIGSYTSPHLERVNQRIAWNGARIGDDALAEVLSTIAEVEPFLDGSLSFFEILTGAALSWFSDVAVDAAVVEVGMGGTWDATNVVDGRVAVVTNVSVDHVEYLGPTREGIAQEKAGIVKPGSMLVLGETDPALLPTFFDRAPEAVWLRDRDFGVRRNERAHRGRVIDFFTTEAKYDEVFLSLHGAHQADNAAIALAATEAFLGQPPDGDIVREVMATAKSPGRLEVVGHHPLVLLDGAHNVAGARSLIAALRDEFPTSPRTLVVGLLREKDPREMLQALEVASAERLVCCRPPSARASDPHELASAALELGLDSECIVVLDDVVDALDDARQGTAADGQIVVTGSLYVVGAARAALVGTSH